MTIQVMTSGSRTISVGVGGGTPAGTVYQTIDGFGCSERVFSDSHIFNNFDPTTGRALTTMTAAEENAVLDALFVDLGLTRLRAVQPETEAADPAVPKPAQGIEIDNDNADPLVTDLTKFNFSFKNVDAHVPVLNRAVSRGVTMTWISPLNREIWMSTATLNDAAEYAEWLLAQVRRFAQQGVSLTHVSVANEPSYVRNTMSGAFIRDVIKNLGPRLAAEGLTTAFVIPDDVRTSDAVAKITTIMSDPIAAPYVVALATHPYDEGIDSFAAIQAQGVTYGLPVWMTEFTRGAANVAGWGTSAFNWAELIHEWLAVYSLSAIDYLWGFFGSWQGIEAQFITLNNSGATYTGFTVDKAYYYTGQYSRFVKPGAQRVSISTSNSSIKVTAYYKGTQRIVVAINPGGSPATTTFTAADLAGVSTMSATRTSATENWASVASASVSGSSTTVTLPAGSVTTFVGTAS